MKCIGWAIFEMEPGRDFNVLSNWNYGAWSPPSQGRTKILTDVKNKFSFAQADHLVCEMPMFFNTEKGRIAAKEGYTLNLSLVIGTIYGCLPNSQLFLYTPQQWKGSVPKSVTRTKFKRTFNLKYVDLIAHDTIDAIMLLRYHVQVHW